VVMYGEIVGSSTSVDTPSVSITRMGGLGTGLGMHRYCSSASLLAASS
jgi:hypothetical protein